MAGVVHIPWYATVFRHERLATALEEIAPIAFKYGATEVMVHQFLDDAYRFDHQIWFESREAFEVFWEGPEMMLFRARHSGWYQVPVLYGWSNVIARYELDESEERETTTTAEQPAAAEDEQSAA
ncbi:MAG TPA: hypothetical protein VGM91_13170 [Conexibacter sp.]|jgi:hypothetical protein